MATKNSHQEHFFFEGMKVDNTDNIESSKSFFYGQNGRLYSKNGKLSFSSIEGTIDVFNDVRILKYLGYAAFKDELILMVKVHNTGDFGIDPEVTPPANPTFPGGTTPGNPTPTAVDFSDLYTLVDDGFYGVICDEEVDPTDPTNDEGVDAFLSIRKENGGFVHKWLWLGDMNWSWTAKICTVGMHENNTFKRIYFTDFINSFRVVNILNGKIENLDPNQFNVFQEFSLSQPLIEAISDGGSLKAGVVFYAYRLISNDGQRTVFSDLSERALIHPGSTGQDIRGGNVGEDTGKKVKIKVINEITNNYDKIEVVAIYYEAEGAPTSIKSIGVQDLQGINTFYHAGNEPGFDLNVTISDLTQRSGGWRFCSDIKTKKNKLIASGLRNVPSPFSLVDIEKDFILRGFNAGGSTYNTSFINPSPKTYRFIPKSGSIGSYRKNKTTINEIRVFGTFNFTLKYFSTTFTTVFYRDPVYNNVTEAIWNFINTIKGNYPQFNFSYLNGNIIIAPVSNQYSLDDLKFKFSTEEALIDADFEYQHIAPNLSGQLIHGAQSYGFEKGNGIRITFKPEFQELMSKAAPFMHGATQFSHSDGGSSHPLWTVDHSPTIQAHFDNSYIFNRQNLFDLKENKFKRGFFKGDIYRLGLQFERAGEMIFTIPIGDIMIPEIGDNVLGLTTEQLVAWQNSRQNGDLLESILTNLIVDVRLNCESRKMYSSIKVVYVQRTPENRTIICQGLSAPLVRYNEFPNTTVQFVPQVAKKWQLPFMGGPGIDAYGVADYTAFGENMGGTSGERGRSIVHRKLFYFDAPEILFDRIPDSLVQTGKVQFIAKVYGDHQGGKYLGHGARNETAPSFSQKIHSTIPVYGRNALPGRQFPNSHGLVGNGELLPNWVNVTVFSEASYIKNKTSLSIYKTKMMAKGEIANGSYVDTAFEISNNAMTLFQPVIYYNGADRYPTVQGGDTRFEGWKSNRHCTGARTLFIKTQEDAFPESFYDGAMVNIPHEGLGFEMIPSAYVKHAVANITKDNEESIYGGRTELAYSRNIFIPLSKTIAIPRDNNRTMRLKVGGDTYCTLFFNNKTQYAEYPVDRIHMMHAGGSKIGGDDKKKDYDDVPKRTGAWAYGVVIESTVDVALSRNLKFYQNSGPVDMMKTTDKINEVYFQEGSLRSHITKPVGFKEDPDMLHVVAVSDTKVMGSPLDNWTVFKINNFYELEKDKGGAYNLGKSLDDLYAIQESQTSRLLLNERSAQMDSSDGAIMFKTGTGEGIDGHQVISDFGTAIRRSVTDVPSSIKSAVGFFFFDERKNELVKVSDGVLVKEDMAYYVNTILANNKVYDVEGFYDELNKETVVRCRTENGQTITFSYNELFGVMNGMYEYDNDQYFVWNNEIIAPKLNLSVLEQFNKGVYLKISGTDRSMKIGVTTNIAPTSVKIFHNFMANINVDYAIEKLEIVTSSGQTRVIQGVHKRYKIREGVHSVPLKNDDDWADLRGEWMQITLEIRNKKNKKIDIFSITNFIRQSYY